MNLKGRRNLFRVLAITVMSMVALLFFQNCGGAISNSQSIQSSSTASGGSSTGTSAGGSSPAPAPTAGNGTGMTPSNAPPPTTSPSTPAPPPSPGTLPVTASLRQSLCNKFVDPNQKASYYDTPAIPSSVTITSGAGNGGGNVGNGDTPDNQTKISYKVDLKTVGDLASSQGITPPSQYVQNPKISCAFEVKTNIEIVKGTINNVNYDPTFSKAIDVKTGSATYGQNIASTNPTIALDLAKRVVKLTSAVINPVTGNDGSITLNLLRDDNGLRCVDGSFYIRFSTRNQVEASNITQNFTATDANYKYVKVIVKDGCWAESRLALPTPPVRIAGYGTAVASSPNWMAVLATKDDGLINGNVVTGSGTVSLFQKNGSSWNFCQKITLPDAVATQAMASVAIAPNQSFLAIGNSNAAAAGTAKAGVVHIYTYNGGGSCASGTMWSWSQKISADTEARVGQGSSNAAQLFGLSVAVNDTRLAVGAPAANNNNGAVYIFSYSSGAFRYADLISNSEGLNAGFGSSLALDGNNLAIGAPQAVGKEGDGDGFASVYNISSAANFLTKVKPTDVTGETRTNMRFGDSLSLMGNRLLVGAPYRAAVDGNGVTFGGAGAAYYYNYAGQANPTTAVAPKVKRIDAGNTANLFVGRAVALSSDGLFVSQDGVNTREGNVSFYKDSRLTGLSAASMAYGSSDFVLFGLDKSASNDFGYAISVSGNNVLIGARVKPSPNVGGGAAYVYLKP